MYGSQLRAFYKKQLFYGKSCTQEFVSVLQVKREFISGTTSQVRLRGRVNNFTINYLLYIKCLILLVVQSITAKLDIQVLHGKYYLCNKS